MKAFITLPVILLCFTCTGFSQKVHKVKKGEHLNLIAKKYGTTAKALQKYNGISNANHLKIGQSIKIPSAGSTQETNSSSTPKTLPEFHTVKKGDTFFGIAAKYGVSATSLKKANPKLDPNKIRIGQRLSLPGGDTTSKKTPEPKEPQVKETLKKTPPQAIQETKSPEPSYTKVIITEQITLSEFAKAYNMTINQVNDSNGWNYDGDTIFDVGSEAYVYRP